MAVRLKRLVFVVCLVSVSIALMAAGMCFNLAEYNNMRSMCNQYMYQHLAAAQNDMKENLEYPQNPVKTEISGYEEDSYDPRVLLLKQHDFYAVIKNSNLILAQKVQAEDYCFYYLNETKEYSENELNDLCVRISQGNEITGYDSNYYFMKTTGAGAEYICLLDMTKMRTLLHKEAAVTIAIGIGILVICMLMIWVFAGKGIRTEVEYSDMQFQLIADAGHELKTPLAVISADTEVLELMQGENEWTKSIMNQVGRLDRLVKGIMELSRYDHEKLPEIREPYAPGIRMREILKDGMILMEEKKLNLVLNIDDNVLISADPGQMDRMLNELFRNACKYTDPLGTIRISLEKNGNHAEFKIWNTHEPMSQEEMIKIFDRFYRNDQARSQKTEGFGIGLAMVKAAVSQNHGKITVSNEQGGIVFTLMFPVLKQTKL